MLFGALKVSTGDDIWWLPLISAIVVALAIGKSSVRDANKKGKRMFNTSYAPPKMDYFDVPYSKKERAKALGLRWHRETKMWFLPSISRANVSVSVIEQEFKRLAA